MLGINNNAAAAAAVVVVVVNHHNDDILSRHELETTPLDLCVAPLYSESIKTYMSFPLPFLF